VSLQELDTMTPPDLNNTGDEEIARRHEKRCQELRKTHCISVYSGISISLKFVHSVKR
jgi:hypothetical protein